MMEKRFIQHGCAALCAAALVFAGCKVSSPEDAPETPKRTLYEIAYMPPENGKFSGPTSAAEGEKVNVLANPGEGFKFNGNLAVTDAEGKALKVTNTLGKYTFSMPAAKVTVSGGEFLSTAAPAFDISYNAPENGSFSGPAIAAEGASVEVRALPEASHAFDGGITAVAESGKALDMSAEDGKYLFTMPAEKVSVSGGTFVFIPQAVRYEISYATVSNGRFSGPAFAPAGSVVEVNVVPHAGHKFSGTMTAQGESGSALTVTRVGAGYRFTMPAQKVSVSGSFTLETFSQMASGGDVYFVETASGTYDEVHVFRFDETLVEDSPELFTDDETQMKHTFATSAEISNARVLILAGGGGGGKSNNWNWRSGGGGAGGLLLGTNITIPIGGYDVRVGDGGAGGGIANGSYQNGKNGAPSLFGEISVPGGGGGGRSQTSNGAISEGYAGGSGGGGTGRKAGGAATAVSADGYTFHGNKGGDAAGMNSNGGGGGGRNYGGGGGGAGAPGEKGGDGVHGGTGGSKGGKGLTWAELGNIVNAGLIGVSGNLYGLAGGGFGSNCFGPDGNNGAGYGGGLAAYSGWVNANGFFVAQNNPEAVVQRDNSAVKDGIPGTGGGGGGGAVNDAVSPGKGGSGLVVIRFSYTGN